MDKALVNNNLKDIMTFLKEDYEAYKEKKVEPKCPYCSNTLYIYGRSSLKRNCRFQHYRKDECRTKKSKSANLPDFFFDNSQIIKDLGNIENLKRIFVVSLGNIENLKRIFVVSRDILKSYKFPVKDFMELLIYPALKENVFFYRGLEIWMLPYILVSIPAKIPIESNGSVKEYRFVIENGLKNLLNKKSFKNKITKVFADSGKETYNREITSSFYYERKKIQIDKNAISSLQNDKTLREYLKRWVK